MFFTMRSSELFSSGFALVSVPGACFEAFLLGGIFFLGLGCF
jgi:hypothetical protein